MCFADVKQHNVTFSGQVIPAQETTVMCMVQDLPEGIGPDEEVHIIATSPKVDNPGMIHHFKLFGCPGEGNMVMLLKKVEDKKNPRHVWWLSG